jgi:hypothetical protein
MKTKLPSKKYDVIFDRKIEIIHTAGMKTAINRVAYYVPSVSQKYE